MNKYLVFPSDYKRSTQVSLFKTISFRLNLEPLDYREFYRSKTFTVFDKILILLYFIYHGVRATFYYSRKSIRVNGIIISHAIIETYLKENKAYKFKRDIDFYKILFEAIKIVLKSKNLMNKVDFLIGGDEAYLFGSILGQLAEANGIPNIYFKDFETLCGFKYNSNMLYAGISNYKQIFDTEIIDIPILETQLKEIVENKTSYFYMRKRELTETSIIDKTNDNYVVLYLHDFFDSPGIFGDSVFYDVPSWVEFCAAETSKIGVKLIVKTHPNAHPSNKPLVEKLKLMVLSKYNHVLFMDSDFILFELSNKFKIVYILTIFGSIIFEAAYLGINVISCGNAPSNFFISLSKNAKNKSELSKLIKETQITTQIEKVILRNKAIESFSTYKYFMKQSELCEIPYDFLSKEVKGEIFKSEFDPPLNKIFPETWGNSIRVENYVRQKLSLNSEWLEKLTIISNGSLPLKF